jgi:hypothetical protein
MIITLCLGDAKVSARLTDTNVFPSPLTVDVTRSGFTEKPLIDFANKQINSKRIKNVGFVLNDVSKENFGYGNKYGYGYGIDEKTFFQKLKDRLFF